MGEVPFDWNVTTSKWWFDEDNYLVLEKTLHGYTLYGRVDGQPFDDGGEDFYFEDSDELLGFLQEHDLIGLLQEPQDVEGFTHG